MTWVWVPKDLLDDLARAPERSQRLLVTAWVLTQGPHDDRRALVRAAELWPPDALKRRARLTVLSVLLELEQLGVVSGVREDGDGFSVTVGEREMVAG